MSDFFPEFSWHILRSTMFLSVAALVAVAALRLLRPSSAQTSALAWTMVLVAGVLLVPAKFEIPWYEPVKLDPVDESSFAGVHGNGVSKSGTVDHARPSMAANGMARASFNRFFWWTAYPAIWLLGGIGIATIAAVGYLSLMIALRVSWKPQRLWQAEYDVAARELAVTSPPKMIIHRHLGPLLCLTPKGYRLVVPSDQWTSLTPAERDVILKHELAHFQRGDVWRSLPIRLVVLLHWFNPLSWMAARRLEEAAEWEADRIATDGKSESAAVLANALLKLSQSTTQSRLLAPAAGGRSLTKRLKNLIRSPQRKGAEPMLKKITVMMVLACVLVAAAVQVTLVAQEERNSSGERSRVTLATAKQFAKQLLGDDDLTNSLRMAIQSEPGALVLRDRAGQYEERARNELREVAIPGLFEQWFETTDAGLKLRSGQDDFRQEYLQAAAVFNDDLSTMKSIFKDVATKMDLNTDLDKLAHRFFNDDGAPVVLYVTELRGRIRPGMQVLEKAFEDVFVRRSDGRFEIRADGRGQAQEAATKFTERSELHSQVIREISIFADDISEKDELHKQTRAALKNPLFVTALTSALFEKTNINRSFLDRILEDLEDGFRDQADGLVIHEEAKPEIVKHLETFERLKDAAIVFREPLRQFSERLVEDDDLHSTWKNMLTTEMALLRVAEKANYATGDIDDAVRELVGRILVEKDNGRFHVDPPELPAEELSLRISQMFRQARTARRKAREVEAITEKVLDVELKEAMQTPGGKIVFADHLQRRLMAEVPDGFEQWVSEHFESTDGGYVIREAGRERIVGVVNHIAEVTKELAETDF